jgi:thiopeptide-type bacteriocin biosynthesis protein
MTTTSSKPLYRHSGVALLRAAAAPLGEVVTPWPDLTDTTACRAWLRQVWSSPALADGIRQASPGLAERVDIILAAKTTVQARQIRRATISSARYLLRATGRHTPFGLFAGVAAVSVGPSAEPRWGTSHRPFVRVDTQWLMAIVERLEACPELLERLDVAFTNLATQRGRRLEAPHGPNRITARYTSAVRAVRDASSFPIRFVALTDRLAKTFPTVEREKIRSMLTNLVRQGFLVTCLHIPATVTDPLTHIVERLRAVEAGTLPSVASILDELEAVRADVHQHNHEKRLGAEQACARTALTQNMRELSQAGRTPLTVDLRLDAEVVLPAHVAREMELSASALMRLSSQPTGTAAWRDFYTAFCERYGTGTLVRLVDVVDPDTGLGFPAGYPGSVRPSPPNVRSERDEKLLTLAWRAIADGSREITLTEETIQSLTIGDPRADRSIPPHVELAARIHATSLVALASGDYTFVVAPARSAGTFTSRFTTVAAGSGLEEVYAAVPTAVDGALPVQLSVAPAYSHAENICRVPRYLPHVLSLGEHRGHDESVIEPDDIAVTATGGSLHLVSMSRRRVIEPQVFHALALEKQPPPLARFLAHLPRALGATWHEFDWGPHTELPYLPRVRYRHAILSPARWRLSSADFAVGEADGWQLALDRWRTQSHCPSTVELRDADRSLRLSLDEPAHATILRTHLARHGHATILEAAETPEFGWIGGHAHEIALPLRTTRPPAPSPITGPLPLLTNHDHGQLPGSAAAAWFYAKIHTHPERFVELINERLPTLLDALNGEPKFWFVRYRSPYETDHLRLRIHAPDREHYGHCMTAVGDWAQQLRNDGVAGRLVIDTYLPEVGRYGPGAAMDAAEDVFAADSAAVSAQLRHLPPTVLDAEVLSALNMIDTVHRFLGSFAVAMEWLATQRIVTTIAVNRSAADQVIDLALGNMLRDHPCWDGAVAQTWQARGAALASYRAKLPVDMNADAVLESLLHMHHNRALGIDRSGETACRRLTRQAALAWQARREGTDR